MATELDIEAALLALELIEEYGKAVVFNDDSTAVYTPATGKVTAGNPTPFNKKIIPPYPYNKRLVDGDVIRAEDLETGVAASGLGFTPERMKTTVIFDSQVWQVISVNPVYSGENVALYLLQLRMQGPEPVEEP